MADGNNNGLSLKVIALMMIAMIIITGIFSYLLCLSLLPGMTVRIQGVK